MDSSVLHDGSVGSHATHPPHPSSSSSSPQTGDPASPTNYRQIGTRKGNGRLLLGAAHSYHASSVAAMQLASGSGGGANPTDVGSSLVGSVPSIPSRYETVLYAGDSENDAFLSRCARFKDVTIDLPGPGAYTGDIVQSNSSIKSQSTSYSSKGYGNGFISKTKRFKQRGGPAPGPGRYNAHVHETIAARVNSAPNRSTAAFRSATHGTLDPMRSKQAEDMSSPGPGYYDGHTTKTVVLTAKEQRKLLAKGRLHSSSSPSQSSLAASVQASLLEKKEPAFNSKDVRFRINTVTTSPDAMKTPGPGDYSPNVKMIQRSDNPHTSLFKSQTSRTDFTASKSDVPPPGHYASDEKEATNGSNDRSVSPSRAFRLTGLDRFGHVKEPKLDRPIVPGPGHYEPLAPARSESPTRARIGFEGARIKHANLTPTSPLAAALAHGSPITSTTQLPFAAASPSAQAVMAKKKRAAGQGGPGKSLLATRGGPGVALNSPHQLFHSPGELKSLGTFGRADLNSSPLSPKQQAKLLLANQAAIVTKESEIRPPGPSYYNPDKAFHAAQDKKTFHLNTASRWM